MKRTAKPPDPLGILEKWARIFGSREKLTELGIRDGSLTLWSQGVHVSVGSNQSQRFAYELVEWDRLKTARQDVVGRTVRALIEQMKKADEERSP